jgi:hypothetical protein
MSHERNVPSTSLTSLLSSSKAAQRSDSRLSLLRPSGSGVLLIPLLNPILVASAESLPGPGRAPDDFHREFFRMAEVTETISE